MNGNQAAQSRQRTPLLTVGDLSLDTEQRVAAGRKDHRPDRKGV